MIWYKHGSMDIGFLTFNQEALNKANKVMRLLQGQGAIDEMGLGRIRDAFSNTMFPGMSTLQTHAKYFLLLPALYSYLERSTISDTREARQKIRDQEIAFTRRLMAGTPKDKYEGIIGYESLRTREKYVKYDPTYIYYAGLVTYGFVQDLGNIYALLVDGSRMRAERPKKAQGNSETGDDSDDLSGNRPLFSTCGEQYWFGSSVPLDISLSCIEAEFLKFKIETNVPQSLMGHLLSSDLYKTVYFYDFENLGTGLRGKVPENLFSIYLLARRFSRFSYLLRLRYALQYDLAVGAVDEAKIVENQFHEYLSDFAYEFTPEAIEEVNQFVYDKITEPTCMTFIKQASTLIAESNFHDLDCLIRLREKRIKTGRSKLSYPEKLTPGKKFDVPAPMSFRWNSIVRRVLSEIKEGMDKCKI